MLNYHKNKKIPTEEEIEAKRVKYIQNIEKARKAQREKYEARVAENPNYYEEMEARRKERHKIDDRNYRIRKAEKKRLIKEQEDTI